MSETPAEGERRAQLLAGAAFDDLDAAEQAELDALAAVDPGVAAELAELRAVVDVLPAAGTGWDDVTPSASLDARIAAITGGPSSRSAADDATSPAAASGPTSVPPTTASATTSPSARRETPDPGASGLGASWVDASGEAVSDDAASAGVHRPGDAWPAPQTAATSSSGPGSASDDRPETGRVAAAAASSGQTEHDEHDDLADRRSARHERAARSGGAGRRLLAVAAAVVLLAVGAAGGIGVDRWQDRPPTGPPGTLGALEDVPVTVPAGVTADVDLVAHTWGTESVMTVSGLEVGSSYTLVLVDADGAEVSSGTLLGSEVPIVCRMNAAVLRPDAALLELRDASGTAVVTAELPPAQVASAMG